MQKSTKGRGPVIAAALGTVVVALLFFGSLLWVMLEEEPIPAVIGIMVVYAVLGIAIVVGVLRAMVQRLREIEGGEEEDAKKVLRRNRPGASGTRCGDCCSLGYSKSSPVLAFLPCASSRACPSGPSPCLWYWELYPWSCSSPRCLC